MSDIECPYCGHEQEINHDDGYGYEEDRTHDQCCPNCEKSFAFTTSVWFSYSATKAPWHCTQILSQSRLVSGAGIGGSSRVTLKYIGVTKTEIEKMYFDHALEI